MPVESKPASKTKMLLVWLLVVGTIVAVSAFFLWRAARNAPREEEMPNDLARSIVLIVIGAFFLFVGAAGYIGVLLTNAMTFDFNRSMFKGVKGRIFAFNIIVQIPLMVGIGCLVASVVTPILSTLNVPANIVFFAPFLATLVVLQIAVAWFGMWTPLDKRLINRRLAALGIRPEQLAGGLYVGLSNPAISSLKRMGGIEADIGMLWITPAQLIYYGDNEQFSLTRDQLTRVERKADAKSVTMLSGTRHVILHVVMADGNARQIRLHNWNIWTMGGKRKAAEELGDRIDAWRGATVPA